MTASVPVYLLLSRIGAVFSFRFRIALFSAFVSGLVLLAFASVFSYLLYKQRIEAVDTEIRALGTRHPGWLANRSNFDRLDAALDFIFGEEHRDEVILLVKDAEGHTLYRSPSWPKALAPEKIDCSLEANSEEQISIGPRAHPAPGEGGAGTGRGGGRGFGPGRGGGPVVFDRVPRFLTAETPVGAWRLGIMGNDELRLVVGLSYDAVRAELNRMRNLLLLTIPVALLLIGGGGWLVAGRALHPLEAIARTAEQVTARGLDQRIPVSNEDPEIRRVIEVLNGMMDRLEASFHQATRFSADASHELKTPLAVMQAELEAAIQSASPGSSEQRALNNLLEETQKLKNITRGLLLLAQADAGQLKLAREPVDLSAEIEAILEDARILAGDANLRFDLDIQPGVCVEGDRGLLRMALLNLVRNAVIYNQPNGTVHLTLAGRDEPELTVSNTGPGIPAADRPRIFDRFFRGKHSGNATEGLGLGLSLAREIILAHRGKLVLQESGPGHTCFRISLKGCALSRA